MSTSPNRIPAELLAILRCPRSGESLQIAARATIDAINEAIRSGKLRDATGEAVIEPLESGLENTSRTWCYPIRDAIPALVPDEAIAPPSTNHP